MVTLWVFSLSLSPETAAQADPLVRTVCRVVEHAGALALAGAPGILWGWIGRHARLAARAGAPRQEGHQHDGHD